MRIQKLRLKDFRNYPWLDFPFPEGDLFLIGANGQGKTNFLEALYVLGSLRSFRMGQVSGCIREGASQGEIFLEHRMDRAETKLQTTYLRLEGGKKHLEHDGRRVERLAEHLGRLPTVVLSSHDLQLLREGPVARRQWLDRVLSWADKAYFSHLKNFTSLLRQRNVLLQKMASPAEIRAFSQPYAEAAVAVWEKRREAVPRLTAQFQAYYRRFAPDAEQPALVSEGSSAFSSVPGFINHLKTASERERALGRTLYGPHRDQYALMLFGKDARHVASEGQQRSMVLALRLAEFDWLTAGSGQTPLLLADDVLGELDATRRQLFWDALPSETQVIATGTQNPPSDSRRNWTLLEVKQGNLSAL